MNQDKLKKLKVYLDKNKERLSNPVPEKHKDNPESFKAFLLNEIKSTQASIDAISLEIK